MRFCFTQNLFKASDFGGEDAASDVGEAVVAAASVAIIGGRRCAGGFLDKAMVHEFFEIVVESAGAEFVLALRLSCDFLHDAVAVEIFGSEREEDVKLGWGEREKRVESVFHDRKPIYRNPSIVVKNRDGWYWKKVECGQGKRPRKRRKKANAEARRH